MTTTDATDDVEREVVEKVKDLAAVTESTVEQAAHYMVNQLTNRTLYEVNGGVFQTLDGERWINADLVVKVVPCEHGNYARHPWGKGHWCDGKPEADHEEA